ncbi:MAG: B12-binding domain-containing radical SAM protein, partial [bacterium]
YGMLRIGAWLESGGWEVRYVNGLDHTDPVTSGVLGRPKRRPDGTGKFHRMQVPLPAALSGFGRRYARYGILPEELERRLAGAGRPDAVFIATGMTYWYPGAGEAAKTVRDLYPGAPLVMGGVYASLLPEHCRETCGPDFIMKGDDIPGLERVLEGLGLPVPSGRPDARTLRRGNARDYAVLRLNHGCPRDCNYCASRILCGGFHPGNPSEVFAEFEGHFSEGVRNFAFYDDALLAGKEKSLRPFLEGVIDFIERPGAGAAAKEVSFYLPNAVHIDLIDEETARLMARAGFREVRFGFESSSKSFHANYGDKFDFDDFVRAVDACRKAGFYPEAVRGYILCGLPGQRWEEVEHSIEYCAELGVRVQLARYSPVPGTRLWPESVRLSRYPIAEEPLFQNNTFFSMEWAGFTREDLGRLVEKVDTLNRRLGK